MQQQHQLSNRGEKQQSCTYLRAQCREEPKGKSLCNISTSNGALSLVSNELVSNADL